MSAVTAIVEPADLGVESSDVAVQAIATARARKAIRLVAECRARGVDAETARRLDGDGQDALAGLAGTRAPSEATWSLVVQLLTDSVPDEPANLMRSRLDGLVQVWLGEAKDAAHASETLLERALVATDDDVDLDRRMASRLGGEAAVLARAIGDLRCALWPDPEVQP